jgi:putative membrane protein insertion efficiency factor
MKRASYANRLVRMVIRAYQRAFSPLLPRACRYVPTCSEYALEAVERHGIMRGGWLAARRLLRCHPLAGSGFDPVPDEAKENLRFVSGHEFKRS